MNGRKGCGGDPGESVGVTRRPKLPVSRSMADNCARLKFGLYAKEFGVAEKGAETGFKPDLCARSRNEDHILE